MKMKNKSETMIYIINKSKANNICSHPDHFFRDSSRIGSSMINRTIKAAIFVSL